MSIVVAVDDVLLVLVDVVEVEIKVKLVALELATFILLVVPAIDPDKSQLFCVIELVQEFRWSIIPDKIKFQLIFSFNLLLCNTYKLNFFFSFFLLKVKWRLTSFIFILIEHQKICKNKYLLFHYSCITLNLKNKTKNFKKIQKKFFYRKIKNSGIE